MNSNLHKAKQAKNDEFYTQYEDIENELKHYTEHFKDKIVYCNCDNPKYSNFWKYFVDNFEKLKLKKLIATYYSADGKSYVWTYSGYELRTQKRLHGDGDFRSQECVDILKQADIVVSNPPFSLAKFYFKQLMKYNKKFLIIGNDNTIIYKDFFPLLKDNQVWKGVTHPKEFIQPDGSVKKFGNISWFTNIEHCIRQDFIPLTAHYSPEKYTRYDNYDAINVDKVKDIPEDYDGVMGVPITFLDKYNPEQFEIIWQASGNTRACATSEILKELNYRQQPEDRGGCGVVNGKRVYSRILIRRK